MEVIFKNKTKRVEVAEIINGNVKITLKGEDARELARIYTDDRFSIDKYIQKLFETN